MTIQEFIEKAEQGGWIKYHAGWHDALGHNNTQCVSQIMLDPIAWQAVGKVEGWDCKNCDGSGIYADHDWPSRHGEDGECISCPVQAQCLCSGEIKWKANMHRLIDALAEASQKPDFNMQKTIEQFLSTL